MCSECRKKSQFHFCKHLMKSSEMAFSKNISHGTPSHYILLPPQEIKKCSFTSSVSDRSSRPQNTYTSTRGRNLHYYSAKKLPPRGYKRKSNCIGAEHVVAYENDFKTSFVGSECPFDCLFLIDHKESKRMSQGDLLLISNVHKPFNLACTRITRKCEGYEQAID